MKKIELNEKELACIERSASRTKERFLSESKHAASKLRQLADELERNEMHTFSVQNIGIVLDSLERSRLENEVKQEDLKVLKELGGED
jgi:hypothetical protein